MLRIGTSGFSYKDWVGSFYPVGTPSSSMFDFYCTQFSTVELDYTYYAMPNPASIARLSEKAPEGFLFSARTHKSITHEIGVGLETALGSAAQFRAALTPLVDKGMMGCVLVQYPWSFRFSTANKELMLRTADAFAGVPVAVEFRNASWADEAIFGALRSSNIALCCVDEPQIGSLFPPIAVSTAAHAYVRFHGRNAKNWWNAQPGSDRYDYDYSDEELDDWVPGIHRILRSAKETYIYMNNCHMGKAAKNARTLIKKMASDA